MKKFQFLSLKPWSPVITVFFLLFGSTVANAQSDDTAVTRAAVLLEKHAALAPQLAQNAYRRPLFLESTEAGSKVSGSAYAVLDSSLNTVSTAFKSPNRWCDVLILHLNTKYCRADSDMSPATLKVDIGKKTPQSLDDAFELQFLYRLVSASPTFLAVQLSAAKGPLSTSNYLIELEAVPLPAGKTFMHLRYSYAYGVAGRLAMQTYLATLGSGKMGFTQIREGAKLTYVGGMRGAVERNTMRYYLAMEAYLASLGQPLAQQVDSRLVHWFDATEEYSRQLHEVDRSSYMNMKKDEHRRQKTE